jgi:hypothetical protein
MAVSAKFHCKNEGVDNPSSQGVVARAAEYSAAASACKRTRVGRVDAELRSGALVTRSQRCSITCIVFVFVCRNSE